MHPRFAPFFQAFEPDGLADITLDTIVFYVKGRVEGVPLYGVSGALGSVLNTKYIVKHRVQSGMLDKVHVTAVEPLQYYYCHYFSAQLTVQQQQEHMTFLTLVTNDMCTTQKG